MTSHRISPISASPLLGTHSLLQCRSYVTTFLVMVLFCAVVFPFLDAEATWAASPPPCRVLSDPGTSGVQADGFWGCLAGGEWGGHMKVRGSISRPDGESYFKPVGTGSYYDGSAEIRFKGKLYFGEWGDFVSHYEMVLSGGDTRRGVKEVEQLFPGLFPAGLSLVGPPRDRRRLMDLTSTIDESDDYSFYHRLDRLYFTVMREWGALRLGRQAITWGNGLLFNPMDLFNPFSPSDIEREYKSGDDMVSLQWSPGETVNVQYLFVPRRDPLTGDIEWDQSSLAGKVHFARGVTECDAMVAAHYDDTIFGIGSAGYVSDAAWRCDAVYTFLDRRDTSDDYLSLVANIDYSWVWWKKNFYGYVEYYFNGLSHDRYRDANANRNMFERIDRGELFVLGRNYVSGHIRVELHPLCNMYMTVITNLNDHSGAVQPRVVWDVATNVRLTAGGNIFYGGDDTEYGGFRIEGIDYLCAPSESAYLWLAWYF